MKNSYLIIVALFVSLAFVACKKKKEGCTDPLSIAYDPSAEVYDGSCRYGGLGGNVTIVAHPMHGGMPIVSGTHDTLGVAHADSAMVKFNAKDSPGSNPGKYDLRLEGEDGEDHLHIHSLKPGWYYIYMTGYDSIDSAVVRGGMQVKVETTSGEMNVNIPVN